jgi:hypothetical protein
MTAYRRASIPGATGFFTVNFAERRDNRVLIDKLVGWGEERTLTFQGGGLRWGSCHPNGHFIWP